MTLIGHINYDGLIEPVWVKAGVGNYLIGYQPYWIYNVNPDSFKPLEVGVLFIENWARVVI